MAKIIRSCAAIVILLVAAGTLLAAEEVPPPIYKDGDYWQFRLGKKPVEVEVKDGKLKFFDPKPDRKREIPEENVSALKIMVAVEKDDREFLKFPLFVGKEWNSEYQQVAKGNDITHAISARSNVTGIEDLVTPAGTLRAFKIVRNETFSPQGPNSPQSFGLKAKKGRTVRRSHTYFYSPESRSLVKYSFEGPAGQEMEIELLKFGSRP
jgi:hypothetical protein